jgi:tRNA(fMet)-specific endonuclease VapC
MFMLDTNTASFALQGKPPEVRLRLVATPQRDLCISEVTRAELLFGAQLLSGAKRATMQRAVEKFVAGLTVLPWDAADAFAELKVSLRKQGVALAPMDMLIAAHAHSAGAVLVTNDRAFSALRPKVQVEDWTRLDCA